MHILFLKVLFYCQCCHFSKLIFPIFFFCIISELVYVPKYEISTKGKCILVHGGNRYVAYRAPRVRNSIITQRWKCAISIKSRYICKAKAITKSENGVESVTFNGTHCHEPPN